MPNLPDPMLSQLAEFVATHMGWDFPRDRWPDLERSLHQAAADFGFDDAEACGRWLLSSSPTRAQIEILAKHMTVGETYFCREKASLDALETTLLPELIARRRDAGRHLQLWSAGCCTGEEAYSIAILLKRLIPDWQEWWIRVLATDINPHFLQKAATGIYSEWSFRGAPAWIREHYFSRTEDGRFEVMPWLRQMVTFSYLNLAEDPYPSTFNTITTMDVILCRNVLMYFTPSQAAKVVEKLHRTLAGEGWLIVSPVEASYIPDTLFEPVHLPGACLYRKRGTGPPEIAAPATMNSQPGYHPEVFTPPLIEERKRVSQLPVAPKAPALYAEALALFEQGQYAAAAAKATERLATAPDDSGAIALLARIYANQGRQEEALAWSRRAVAADRLNPAHHYLYATVQAEQGLVDEAAISLKQALYLDYDFVLAHFALGNLARLQGKPREAARHFENTLALLRSHGQDDLLPESDGMTAGGLMNLVQMLRQRL